VLEGVPTGGGDGVGAPAWILGEGPAASTTVPVAVTVANSLTRDTGSLKITKTVDKGSSSFSIGSFGVHVVCSGDLNSPYDRTIVYPTPGYITITGIPTGSSCAVTEPTLPTAPTGYSWGDPVITGIPATITKDSPAAVTVANSFTRIVVQGFALDVSKTTAGAYTRTYTWTISKSVDKTLVEQLGGGSATFNYTVTVRQTGFSNSGTSVSGTITASNPLSENVTGATVTDKLSNATNCTVTGGSNATLKPGSNTFAYSCSLSVLPSSSLTNTATVTWPDQSLSPSNDFLPGGSALFVSGSIVFAQTSVNKTITVKDTFNGTTTTLDTLTGTDTTPYTSHTYTYSRTVSVPTSNCLKYTNTARIYETGQTATATIEVCGPAKTGGLTMGYWNNKNGQAIISGATQSALGTWLRAYHPFSAAPSTGLSSYVSRIINAATCTSSSNTCNTMLRAQMLATALDVYFSNSALGGNKINAPAPIGGVTIDLTKICKMIDNTNGTGTCSGSFESVRAAFGGATSLTVLAMLSYQNTADPAADAGASWYGQVKATQVLAKDAFDAINNGVAFSP
jgi:hypothetical protein